MTEAKQDCDYCLKRYELAGELGTKVSLEYIFSPVSCWKQQTSLANVFTVVYSRAAVSDNSCAYAESLVSVHGIIE